jgi:RHS repeat-associated protein
LSIASTGVSVVNGIDVNALTLAAPVTVASGTMDVLTTSASATVTGSTIGYVNLSGGVPVIAGNTFTDSVPIRVTDPDLMDTSGFSGNTFTASDPQVDIKGSLEGTKELGLIDGMGKYAITGWWDTLAIASGATLRLMPGVEFTVFAPTSLVVDGALEATDATLNLTVYSQYGSTWTGSVDVRAGGRCEMHGGTVSSGGTVRVETSGLANLEGVTFAGATVTYNDGSSGLVDNGHGTWNLSVASSSGVWIVNNSFVGASVSVTGNSSATIDMENNWWGSTDPAVIETRVTHHVDNASLPWVDFLPSLQTAPVADPGLHVMTRYPRTYPNSSMDHLEVRFDRAVDLTTFTPDDVVLTGPAGRVPITSIQPLGNNAYALFFGALPASGRYTLVVGPNIKDMAGKGMDQNLNGMPGEAGDAYRATLTADLVGPRVISQVPGGDVTGTVEYVDVTFNEPIDAATFAATDVAFSFPCTSPTVTKQSDSRFRISFPGQTVLGQHTVTVGPHITDLAGNPMDQNRDGVSGQPGDAYQGTFTLVDVDLDISNLVVGVAELWTNDTVHTSWDGANRTGYELLGDWTDAVYLSADDTWDMGDILLATVPHTGGLASGTPYSAAVDVTVPGVLPGNYRIIVRADMYGQEKEAGRKGNNVIASGALPLHVRALATDGTPASGTLSAADRSNYYAVQLPPRQNVKLTLDSAATAGANETYAKYNGIPTRQDYDYRVIPNGPDAELTVPATYDGGTYYVLVYADQVSGAQAYQLKGQASGIFLTSVTPDHYGKTSPGTLTLTGDGFDDTTVVELIASDNSVVAPTRTNIISSTQLTADFNLPAIAAGVYEVRVRKAGGAFDEKVDAFSVVAGMGPRLQANLIVPANVRARGSQTCWIEFSNTGDAPMAAPLLRVSTDGAAYITLDPSLRDAPAWPPPGVTDTITAWATGSGATPGTLKPGDSSRIAFYYLGMKSGASTVPYTLSSVSADSTEPVDWASIKNDARPEWIPADAWDAQWTAFTAQMGATWGDFVRTRAEILNYLQGVGEDAASMSMDEILAFAIVQASQAGPGPILASAVDAYSTAPGIPLVFGRLFSQSPESRFSVGTLGHGWSSNWDYSVLPLSSGDVVIRGPGGYDRLFEKGPTSGTFLPLPGDYGTLTLAGGLYRLREKDGTIYQFRSDLLLDYVEDTNGNHVTCGYTSGRLVSLTHSNGDQILIDYTPQGRIWYVTDPLGPGTADDRVTTFAYDASGTYLLSVTAPGLRVTTYTYQTTGGAPALHSLLSVCYPDGKHTYFGYDAYGRVSETSADGGAERVTYSYPSLGTVVAVDAAGVTATVRNGSSCQPARVELPGSVVRLQYGDNDELAQLTGPEGQLSRFSYDASGNLTGVVDPTRAATGFAYEPMLNELTSLTDARGNGIDYAYDAKGNLTRITYEDGTHEDFTYDSVGNVLSWTNRRGQTVTYAYDASGQLTSKDYPDTPGVIDYVYTYDAARNFLSATDASGTTTFAYQPTTDWLTRIDYPGGKSFTFEYDAAGRRTRRTDQDGNVENYAYDALGRLDTMTDGAGGLIVNYDYDAAGRLVRKALGNGVYTTYEYDAAGQLTHLVNRKADGTILSRFDYTYNASGQRTSMTTLEGTWSYSYDASGQLTGVTYPDGRVVTYVYDAVGNRIEVIDDGISTAYAMNNMNQYTAVGEATYTFDADGNMASKTEGGVTTTYAYDIENRLVGVTTPTDTWTYTYDAFGNRIASTHNDEITNYVIDPIGLGDVAAEYDDGGNLIARYDHGYGLVAQTDSLGNGAYYTFSAIGNTSELTSATGTVLNSYTYDPFGISLSRSEAAANPFEFVGEYGVMNESSGLEFMRARFYDTSLGRFSSEDPQGIAGGDLNLRVYVSNSPVDRIDPTGKFLIKIICNIIGYPDPRDPRDPRDDLFKKVLSETIKQTREQQKKTEPQKGLPRVNLGDMTPRPEKSNVASSESETGKDAGLSRYERWKQENEERARQNAERHQEADNLSRSQNTKPPDKATAEVQKSSSQLVRSYDPNDKIAPSGFGEAEYVQAGTALSYRMNFENQAQASAPAQVIVVTDVLDSDLDLNTFQLTEIAFANHVVAVPTGLDSYQTSVDLRLEGKNVVVQIDVSLERDTRLLTATFMGIDPATGWLPEDPLVGILYPNDATGRGEGHLSYIVSPKPGLPSGTRIENQASIVFDWNDPVNTPKVLNTLDAAAPASDVDALPPAVPTMEFPVFWSGEDEAGGSGIATFDVFVSDNGGEYRPWLTATTATSAPFTGEDGHTYAFYTVSKDNVGHVEDPPAQPDAVTSVGTLREDWKGIADDHWENADNWSEGLTPGSGTTVTVDGQPPNQPPNQPAMYQGQHVKGLDLRSAGALRLTPGGNKVLVTKSLSIDAASAVLDLTDNALIIDYPDTGPTPLDNIRDLIATGYAGGTWTGNGIKSSAVAPNLATYGLGYAQNDALVTPFDTYRTFEGEPVDPTAVLVKYTYLGDLNLDGKVDDNDVTILVLNYDKGKSTDRTWQMGDIARYDGKVDDNDVTLLVLNYGAGWKPGRGGPLGGDPVAAALPTAAPEVLMTPDAIPSAPPVEDADLLVCAQATRARQTALGSVQAVGGANAAPPASMARSGSTAGSAFAPDSGRSAADDPSLVFLAAAGTPLAWSTAEEVAPTPGATLSPDGGVEDLLLLPALEIPTR